SIDRSGHDNQGSFCPWRIKISKLVFVISNVERCVQSEIILLKNCRTNGKFKTGIFQMTRNIDPIRRGRCRLNRYTLEQDISSSLVIVVERSVDSSIKK